MLLTEDFGIGDYHISAYSPGEITVNKIVYTNSVIISPYYFNPNWAPNSLSELESKYLDPFWSLDIELVLLGTGLNFQIPSPLQLVPFYTHQLKIEYMDTGAACRTYVALMSEGRRVAAALLIK